jgi:hypothetical protein
MFRLLEHSQIQAVHHTPKKYIIYFKIFHGRNIEHKNVMCVCGYINICLYNRGELECNVTLMCSDDVSYSFNF